MENSKEISRFSRLGVKCAYIAFQCGQMSAFCYAALFTFQLKCLQTVEALA